MDNVFSNRYKIYDLVTKNNGYNFEGLIVSVFNKISGEIRYVVENKDGLLLIFPESSLSIIESVNLEDIHSKNPIESKFRYNDFVIKDDKDYYFEGNIVSIFRKMNGSIRYIVENKDKVLHVFSDKNIQTSVSN